MNSIVADDALALIIGQPDAGALEKVFTIQTNNNYDYAEKQVIQRRQIRDAFIPCFNFLMTCKRYDNHTFKEKVRDVITSLYFPQGIIFFMLPQYCQFKVFTEVPYTMRNGHPVLSLSLYEKQLRAEKLIDLCLQDHRITTDEILKVTDPLNGTFNDIIYLKFDKFETIDSYTLIEHLNNALVLKLAGSAPGTLSPLVWDISSKNLFVLVDYLCIWQKIDLALPVVSRANESIEEYIHTMYQHDKNNLENEPLTQVPLLSEQALSKSIYTRPAEYPHVIATLIDLFLAPSPEMVIHIKKKIQRKKSLSLLPEASVNVAWQEKKKFYNKLIKIGVASILGFMAIITIFKKFVRNDTHFSFIYPFCKLFYHR